MKNLFKILLIILNMSLLFYSLYHTIDNLPFHFTDFVVGILAIFGVIYATDLIVEYVYKFIEYLKKRNEI